MVRIENFDGAGNGRGGGVTELPLFPLDLVLFPRMPLSLRIFEDRYKAMVNRCVREGLSFGIVLATGADESGMMETCRIGCSARIARVERLPDGCMNIEVIGESRFRIVETHERMPYRVGKTIPFLDAAGDSEAVAPLADEVHRLLRDFLTRSLALSGQSAPELPDDPTQLSFRAAWVLPIDTEDKQALLSDDSAQARLSVEREILRREVTRLRRAAESRQVIWRPVNSERFSAYLCAN